MTWKKVIANHIISYRAFYPPFNFNNLAAVSGRGTITLSFNIFEKHPKYDYILELASKYHIDSSIKIRTSFSLPVVGANNSYAAAHK